MSAEAAFLSTNLMVATMESFPRSANADNFVTKEAE